MKKKYIIFRYVWPRDRRHQPKIVYWIGDGWSRKYKLGKFYADKTAKLPMFGQWKNSGARQ